MQQPQHFTALLEPGERALGWTIARLPFAPAQIWPGMVRQRVRGTVGGFAFRTSWFADVRGPYLLVNRTMQQAAGIAPGSVAEFTLAPDLDPRPAGLHDELAVLLEEVAGLRVFYDSLGESVRRELGKWIDGVKGDEARARRIEQAAERLLATFEAERELPPLLATAFRLNPRAAAGWQRTSTHCRRTELLALFSYRSPESRAKRLAKLVAAAEARAQQAPGHS